MHATETEPRAELRNSAATVPGSRSRAHHRAGVELRRWLRPPKRQTVSEWADENRILSPESSAEPGPWRTSRAPYLREIMDTLGDPLVRKVAWVAASQVGKTEVLKNYLGSRIDEDPAPIMVILSTKDKARSFSRIRLAPMLRDTACLRGKVRDARSRDSGNTTLQKKFTGGVLTLVGANSPSDLSSDPIRDLLADEIDRYPASAGSEGDPLSLGIQRTRNFWNRTVFLVSSPGEKDTSRIWPEWGSSDQRRFYVPCPHCGAFQVLEWRQVQWDKRTEGGKDVHRTETAYVVCSIPGADGLEDGCGAVIDETDKHRMLERGEWRATNPFGRFPGFHISALYSPWVTWAELAEIFIAAKDDPELLQTFVNLQLGEPWVEHDEEWAVGDLRRGVEKWAAEVPHGVGVLTASVDVQDDRLEVAVKGWGAGEESWLIAHHRIHGDPEHADVWEELEAILGHPYVHESGQRVHVRACMIDSGYLPDRVYRFVRGKEKRRVYASKGADARVREPLTRITKKNKGRVRPWTINTHHFKTIMFRRIRLTANQEAKGGPRFMHFCTATKTGADAEYFEQFAAEVPRKKRVGRQLVRVFEQVRDRNEAIDLEVYALAALYSMGDVIVKRLAVLADRLSETPEPDELDAESEEVAPARKAAPRRRRNWATDWRRRR